VAFENKSQPKRIEGTRMIRDEEIKSKARVNGVPASTIERDYTQGWFLKNFATEDTLLKGGTGIKKFTSRITGSPI